ncbi:hypothetical protein [Paraglaciecola hydrolytica]|uniref:Uncharacterized protein n=1 Tax=Paraglaciecola hydrolytica TaxID=1799789 RepID=A0A136A167_9ALTE|nr:hypothetical protein [Paraglaciecola hydrolytica]KXI28971.1 hypothetical protein AX660_12405 [Paraglaciecola hydrolytica]
MMKCDLFPVLDNQSKRIKQLKGLSNLLIIAGGLPDHSKSDLCACLSIVSDIASDALDKQKTINHEVTQLALISNCVAGIG